MGDHMAPEQGRRCRGELGKCITIKDLTGDLAATGWGTFPAFHSLFLPHHVSRASREFSSPKIRDLSSAGLRHKALLCPEIH